MTVERIYELHADFVFRTLRSLGVPESDVGDALQEVFLTIHRTLSAFENRCSMKTWLFTIARSVARDRRRRAHVRHEVLDEVSVHAEPDRAEDASSRFDQRQRLAELDSILATLDEVQRIVFVLFEIEDMAGQEISDALEIPLGTVYSRLRLARVAFRAEVERRRSRELSPLRVASRS